MTGVPILFLAIVPALLTVAIGICLDYLNVPIGGWILPVLLFAFMILYAYSPLPNGPKIDHQKYTWEWGWTSGVRNPNLDRQRKLRDFE